MGYSAANINPIRNVKKQALRAYQKYPQEYKLQPNHLELLYSSHIKGTYREKQMDKGIYAHVLVILSSLPTLYMQIFKINTTSGNKF